MPRVTIITALMLTIIGLWQLGQHPAAEAQPHPVAAEPVRQGTANSNEICVTIFNDVSQNGERDPDETLLAGINIVLQIETIIIDTQLSQSDRPTCFVGLAAGSYRVMIPDTRRHQMTTRNDAAPAFTTTGSRFNVAFGVLLLDPFTQDAALPDFRGEEADIDLDQETRLLLAIMGSGVVMLGCIGLGAVVLGIINR